MAISDEYATLLTKMTIEELKTEYDKLLSIPQKAYDFELVAKAQAVHDEMVYRQRYKPLGYTRYQAGFLMAFLG